MNSMVTSSLSFRINNTITLRHTQSLNTLQQLRFTGRLELTSSEGQQWFFQFSQGKIVYATGGEHLMRRWRRNLATFCPRIPSHRIALQCDLANQTAQYTVNWEYTLLNLWVSQNKITVEQVDRLIRSIVTEVIFDIGQVATIVEKIVPGVVESMPLGLIEVGEAIAEAQKLWNAWQTAKLGMYSPNSTPVIVKPQQLQQYSSPTFYRTLAGLLNGQHTLRDLALHTQHNVVAVTSSLVPYIRLGWIDLQKTHDLSLPTYKSHVSDPPTTVIDTSKMLIACVDDSLQIREMMGTLLRLAGYQFLGISDGLRALATLLSRKPDLIFLDLVMPQINGYEICKQLRKISCFRHTPIIILTANDGLAKRLESNFVGATEFLTKPLDADAILSAIHHHLQQNTVSH